MEKLGTQDNPHTVAPENWLTDGFSKEPYGSVFCKCAKCSTVARCTFSFDFYADKAGEPLVCEGCTLRNWRSPSDVLAFQAICAARGDIYEESK